MEHIPICVSVSSNIPSYENKWIFNENPKQLVIDMFKWFDIITDEAYRLMKDKMRLIFNTFEAVGIKDTSKIWKRVDEYCKQVPIVGFNNGKYDTGLIKNYNFFNEIYKRDQSPFIIKSGKQYKQIKTNQFIFLDQMLYCGGGTTLKDYIKAYTKIDQKFTFPYEKFTSLDFLNRIVSSLKYEDFYSQLKGRNLIEWDLGVQDDSGKLKVKGTWDDFKKKCEELKIWDQSIKKYLEVYNCLDTKPLLDACLIQKNCFKEFHLDKYKDAMTVSCISQKVLNVFALKDLTDSLQSHIFNKDPTSLYKDP